MYVSSEPCTPVDMVTSVESGVSMTEVVELRSNPVLPGVAWCRESTYNLVDWNKMIINGVPLFEEPGTGPPESFPAEDNSL